MGRGCHARWQLAHREQFGDTLMGSGGVTCNPPVTSWHLCHYPNIAHFHIHYTYMYCTYTYCIHTNVSLPQLLVRSTALSRVNAFTDGGSPDVRCRVHGGGGIPASLSDHRQLPTVSPAQALALRITIHQHVQRGKGAALASYMNVILMNHCLDLKRCY